MAQSGQFGRDLDISDIVAQYEVFCESTAGINFIDTDSGFKDPQENFDAIPRGLYEDHWLPEDPFLTGSGPSTCSAEMGVGARKPLYAWDSNGYYRSLMIPWPYVDAPKKMLRIAYMSLGGPDDVWLTHCFKQLLHQDVRDAYDRLALGERLIDSYVQDELKAKAVAEAVRRRKSGMWVEAEEVLDEWGYNVEKDENTFIEPGDEIDLQETLDSKEAEGLNEAPTGWGFSYYKWRVLSASEELLQEWQAELIRKLSAAGVKMNFGVGLMGKTPHQFLVGEADDRRVFFLNKDFGPEGLESIAALAVTQLMRDLMISRQITAH